MKKLLPVLFLLILPCIFADPIQVHNDYIKIVMDDITGMFGIGKPDDTPYIEGFPTDLTNAHFVARVNGSSNSNAPGIGLALSLLDTGRVMESEYLTIQWMRDPVRIWQKLYLFPEDSLDAFCDIELLAYNDSPDSNEVGFLLYMDVCAGSNSNPVLEFPTGVVTTTQKYMDDDVPAYWTLYEEAIDQDSSQALSQGVTYGREMIFPDIAVFDNASLIEDDEWSLTTLPGLMVEDLAIALRWDSKRIPPYSWYIVQCYYGGGYPTFSIPEDSYRKPQQIALGNPYPNPFNAEVNLPFAIDESPSIVNWNIYNLRGQVVRHATPRTYQPGEYAITWNGRGDLGQELSSGIYLFAMWADGVRSTKRLVLLE